MAESVKNLLELAAKAAGYEVLGDFPHRQFVTCGGPNPLDGVDLFGLKICDGGTIRAPWNPLEDSAQCFELQLRRRVSVVFAPDPPPDVAAIFTVYGDVVDGRTYAVSRTFRRASLASAVLDIVGMELRRAVVEVVAEQGRAMP